MGLPLLYAVLTRYQPAVIHTGVLLISHTCPIDIPYLYRYGISMGYIWDIYGTSPCLVYGNPLIGGRFNIPCSLFICSIFPLTFVSLRAYS
jgi:hypothetical protein